MSEPEESDVPRGCAEILSKLAQQNIEAENSCAEILKEYEEIVPEPPKICLEPNEDRTQRPDLPCLEAFKQKNMTTAADKMKIETKSKPPKAKPKKTCAEELNEAEVIIPAESEHVLPIFSKNKILNLEDLCKKLNCPQLAYQIEKLTKAQDQLSKMQNRELFDRIFNSDYLCFRVDRGVIKPKVAYVLPTEVVENAALKSPADELGEEEELVCIGTGKESLDLLPENEWHGYFKGYEILTETNEFGVSDLRKCVEIKTSDKIEQLEAHLRAGVRCFMIDLFKGNVHSNQSLVVRFRQSELNLAKELGFPVTSTLIARLSPRLQYTGYLEAPLESVDLCAQDFLTITTDRYWATHCTNRRIYVNARFLLLDTRRCDILLVGLQIQLQVHRVMEDALRCKVIKGGKLRSRMPVLFHKRCQRFRLSFNELEDITFVKEVGINVIVSDMIGTPAYLKNLKESLEVLGCKNMRVFARFIMNNVDDEDTDYKWAKCAYDGFLGQLSTIDDGCGGDGNFDDMESLRILFLNEKVANLIETAHRSRKPFIFDPAPLINDQYVMDPANYKHVLYHPDKYLVQSNDANETSHLFFMLANALGAPMPENELSTLLPFCDPSHSGSDSLALATAAASFETGATSIFVLGVTGRMATKIAVFRPRATIYFISALKSAADYISTHHNIVMLYYCANESQSHEKAVYKELLFGLSYALAVKNLNDGDQVFFVYSQKSGQLFPDKYLAYKFDRENFVKDLARILF